MCPPDPWTAQSVIFTPNANLKVLSTTLNCSKEVINITKSALKQFRRCKTVRAKYGYTELDFKALYEAILAKPEDCHTRAFGVGKRLVGVLRVLSTEEVDGIASL